jgi:glycosyltransferase involved in cell wall biosynthesis
MMPPKDYELALVMPVYNEEGCIAAVVRSWRDALRALGIHFVMIVINDGSRDRTASILDEFAADECIRVIHQANAGHGPTVLRGYAQAVTLADWVFQCDSDNEIGPDSFGRLWEVRHETDAVFGARQNRRQNLQRSLISYCSRKTVELLFGRGVEDVNSPYRLMRSSALDPILEWIPPDTFAPNVILCGALTFAGARVRSVPVVYRLRQTGRGSIVRWKLWNVALRSFGQTLRCSRQIRRSQLRARYAAGVLDAPARSR